MPNDTANLQYKESIGDKFFQFPCKHPCIIMAAKCPNEVCIEAIIKDVMKDYDVDPQEIPEEGPFDLKKYIEDLKHREKWSKRYFRGHAKGIYTCDKCDHQWTSIQAWCILDLKRQRVVMKFKQKCKKKHEKDMPEVEEEPSDITAEMEQLKMEKSSTFSLEDEVFTGVLPCYSDKSNYKKTVRYMVKWAVEKYLVLSGKIEPKIEHNDTPKRRRPHIQRLCQMCKLLKRRCF